MSQCVPSWDLNDTSCSARVSLQTEHHADSTSTDVPLLDCEIAELRWKNGKLAFNCIGQPRAPGKSLARYTWEKPRANGTLEAIVSQAIRPSSKNQYRKDMDALVPCADRVSEKAVIGTSTYVAACSAAFDEGKRFTFEEETAHKSGESATADRRETRFTVDTGDLETMTSTETNSSGVPMPSCCNPSTVDDHGSVKRRPDVEGEDKKKERCSVPIKKSRATATHNQSERKRRDKINQRMKILQKLVPNSKKTDKASVLDEVIEYLKQLQAQVQMMNSMNNMSQMMMPVSLPQLQMWMMTQMMGMGVMDMNPINSAGGVSPLVFPGGYIPTMENWDVGSFPINRLPQSSAPILPDVFSNFMACHSPKQLNVDVHNRMVAMYQQLCQQPPAPPSSTGSEI